MVKKVIKIPLTLAVLAIILSACTLPWQKKAAVTDNSNATTSEAVSENTASHTYQIKKFGNYDELKLFLQDNNNTSASLSNLAVNNISSTTAGSVSFDYSLIGNKISGVDEPDIIKNDGTYIYALVRNDLKIIKINPASEGNIVKTITFKSRPQNILINGTNIAVFGADQQIANSALDKTFRRQNPYTFFKVYDLTNPAEPKLVRDLNFEGSYTDARLIGDYVYLFTVSSGNYIESEPLVPRVIDNGEVLPSICDASSKCFTPDVYYFDIPYGVYDFANVAAINIKDNNEALSGESYLLNRGQNLYIAQDNFYITYTATINEYDLNLAAKKELLLSKLSADDQGKINKIEAADNFIISLVEKKSKVNSIIDNYLNSLTSDEQATIKTSLDDSLKQKVNAQMPSSEKTIIHKIGINGNKVDYQGMGEIGGQMLNQFSIDENGDNLRIATARNPLWSRFSDKPNEFYSSVYVLGADLKVAGSLENIITNEKISSARFIGNRAYLITYNQSDPLYAISLNDITKPAILGAVKIPAYASYLHPADVNGNKLFGLGYDTATDNSSSSSVNGLKLALFDFSDLNNPKELSSYLVANADNGSIVLQDHKSFLYSEEKNLLSVPAILRDNNKISFAGSLVFNITNNKFILQGKIDHSAGDIVATDYINGYDYYDNTVKRSFYSNDNFFTFSNNFLKINNLSDLKTIKNIALTSGGNDCIIIPTPLVENNATSTSQTATTSPLDQTATTSPLDQAPPVDNQASSTPNLDTNPDMSTSSPIN
jgi:uncharacterized secreted protein with C-terminal beta-propeller domain